jgi:hypothetical protein
MDIVKCDLRWDVGNIGMAANVFQLLCVQQTPHVLSDVDALIDMADYVTNVLTPMAPHVVVTVDVRDLAVYKKVGALWNLVGNVPIAFTPGSIGDPLPSGVAGLMTAYTDTSKVMGKKYLPGLSETGQTAGLWIANVLSAMLQSGIVWITGFASLNDPLTYWYPGVYSAKTLGFKLFTSAVAVRDVPAYQRRRKQGVGA